MKKAINNIILIVLFAGLLCGCGEGSGASDAVQDISKVESQEISAGAGNILDPFAVMNLSLKDNSLDAYSSAGRAALQPEKPENEGGGMERSVLGVTGAYHFKKHVLSTAAESWDEVLFITGEGKAISERYEVKDQLWGIGQVVGTDHYVVFSVRVQEDGEYQYFLAERDEDHEYIREFPLNFLSGEVSEVTSSLSKFLVDQSGRVHLVRDKYMIVSQEGEVLGECTPEGGHIKRLVPLYDGRIAFEVAKEGKDGGMALQYMDGETGSPVTLAALKENVFCLTLFDEDTLLYADREGVYRSGLSGENPEMIYRWSNHGVIAHGVSALQADEKGRITLIYRDSENDNYLCLEPTTEKVPVCEITLKVHDSAMDSYKWVVAEFNKRYPSCHIELSGYTFEDKTALLTQLTAGKGPVLLDPSLLGFEELEELWEPLDTVMEQLGIAEELHSAVMEMGKINGTLYGVVGNFGLYTVVASTDLKDWDYDTFFQCIQDRPELEAICNYYDDAHISYFSGLLNHGLDDNYYIIPSEETGELHFDSGRFLQFLDVAEKHGRHTEIVAPGSSLLEGKTLCNTLPIQRPEYIAAYRKIYGEDVNFIGYPTKDGGTHYMRPSDILSIRTTATKEEKEAAAAFLALYLSYEGQIHGAKEGNFELSVRRDVLEEQIASMRSPINMPSFGEVSIGSMDIERDRATLLDLIERAKPQKSFPGELNNIIYEELDLYLSGSITKDAMIEHLENRIGLYLGERN